MKKIKLFLCVALFGAMSFGAFSAYQSMTMSEEERFLLANIEALTNGEPGGGGTTHSLECGKGTIKMCEATCGICQVTLKAWGNGSPVTLTCSRN